MSSARSSCKRARAPALVALLLVLAASPASAHLQSTGLGPFYDGVAHLALSPEDLVLVLAVGLLAGLRGALSGRRALATLPAAWLAGGLAGSLLAPGSSWPWLTVASFTLLGGLVAADVRVTLPVLTGLCAAAGSLHGSANGSSLGSQPDGIPILIGIAVAVFVVLALAAGFVSVLEKPWTRIAARVAGSWIAAAGLLLFGWLIRGRA